MYIHAYSYDSDIPTTFYKELQCVAQRDCYPKRKPWFRVKELTSMAGRTFSSLAKYKRFGDGECLQLEHTFQDSSVKSYVTVSKIRNIFTILLAVPGCLSLYITAFLFCLQFYS